MYCKCGKRDLLERDVAVITPEGQAHGRAWCGQLPVASVKILFPGIEPGRSYVLVLVED